jgi:hypothetical protein
MKKSATLVSTGKFYEHCHTPLKGFRFHKQDILKCCLLIAETKLGGTYEKEV